MLHQAVLTPNPLFIDKLAVINAVIAFPTYLCASISMVCGEWETCVGDVAYGDELNFSDVDNLDRAIKASGKLGGVAGVLAGAHNWK